MKLEALFTYNVLLLILTLWNETKNDDCMEKLEIFIT